MSAGFGNETKIDPAIRVALETDADKICNVLIRSIREVCAADYGNDQELLDSWCSNKTPENTMSWINNSENYCVVAELAPFGVVGAAMYSRLKSALYLCYIVPEGLHRGIGSKLLLTIEAEAKRLGHEKISLTSTITAHDFYKRHGYQDSGEPSYMGKVKGFPMQKLIM